MSLWKIITLYFRWRRYVEIAYKNNHSAWSFPVWLRGGDRLDYILALGHIENLLDCINDARESTMPPVADGEQLCTISFGYADKIKAANEFLKSARKD